MPLWWAAHLCPSRRATCENATYRRRNCCTAAVRPAAMPKHIELLSVSPELPSRLGLWFADGACMWLDVAPLIPALPPAFEALQDPGTFMRVAVVGNPRPDAVCWPARQALTLCGRELRAHALQQATGRGPVVVWDWMATNGLSVPAAAAALGVSRRMVVHYRSAKHPVPRKVVLAIAGWMNQQKTRQPAPACAPEELRQWLARWGFSYRLGALALGVSRRMLAYYLSGAKPVPQRVALSMAGWRG